MRIRPWDWAEVVLSYQRGDTVGANLNFTFDLGRPLLPIADPPLLESTEMRFKAVLGAVNGSAFPVRFSATSGSWKPEAICGCRLPTGDTYTEMKAMGVVLRVVDRVAPPGIQGVHIFLTQLGIPMTSFRPPARTSRMYATKQLNPS